jgi:hypothetical protein
MFRRGLAPAASSQICADSAAEKGIEVHNNWSGLSAICHPITLSPVAYRPPPPSLYATAWLHLQIYGKQFRRIHAKEYSRKKAVEPLEVAFTSSLNCKTGLSITPFPNSAPDNGKCIIITILKVGKSQVDLQ